MRTKRIQPYLLVVFSCLLMIGFINAGRINHWEDRSLERVDLRLRNQHARELLGASYTNSAARFHESNDSLSKDILRRVRRSLPASHRRYAPALTQTILTESKKYGFDPVFVLAVIQTESKWNPNAIGSVGEIGLMQIRPETAKWMADKTKRAWQGKHSLRNPMVNVQLGVAYMAFLKNNLGPHTNLYVAAYNMGPGNARKLAAQKIAPVVYRSKILDAYEDLYRRMPAKTITTAGL